MTNKIYIIDPQNSILSKDLLKSLVVFFPNFEFELLSLNMKKSKKNPIIYMWSTFSLISKIKKNDLVILFSPLIIYAPFLFLNKSIKICLYFDFFPIHQIQLKVITKFKKILYLIERYLFNKKMYAVAPWIQVFL